MTSIQEVTLSSVAIVSFFDSVQVLSGEQVLSNCTLYVIESDISSESDGPETVVVNPVLFTNSLGPDSISG